MKIYLLFRHTGKGNGLIMSEGSRLLRSADGSYFDHVEFLVSYSTGVKTVYAATFNGVRNLLFSDWLSLYENTCFQVCEIPIEVNNGQLLESIISDLGKKYDFIGLFHQLIKIKFFLWIGRRGNKANKKVYCSEWVANKINLLNPESISVADLYFLTSERLKINKLPTF